MPRKESSNYLTLPAWQGMPGLIHGFGLARFSARDLLRSWPGFAVVALRQIHSDRIHILDRVPSRPLVGDGLATALPNMFLVVKTADCLPVLLFDDERRIVAALHCGWRGTARRLCEKAVAALTEKCGTCPASVRVAMGPCIGADCYEVGEDVRQEFFRASLPLDAFRPHPSRAHKFLLDLRAANRRQLLRAGIPAKNIFALRSCTHCDPRLESYRRDRDRAGRLLSFIGLRSSL